MRTAFEFSIDEMNRSIKWMNRLDWTKIKKDVRGHPTQIYKNAVEFKESFILTKEEETAFELKRASVEQQLIKKNLL